MLNDREGYSVELGFEKGRPPPEWWLDGPEIPEGAEFYIGAWQQLGTTRSFNLGIGPIPWDTIVTYGQFYGLDHEQLHDFVQVIMAMDTRYLTIKQREHKEKDPGNG